MLAFGRRGSAVRREWFLGALIAGLLALTLWSGTALAGSAPRVALLTSNPADTTTKRLKAELTQLGVETVVVRTGPNTPVGRVTLESVARRVGAFAAIRIVPVESEVEVWVADRVTGKTVVREVLHGSGSAARDDTIALGAVELLRASLLEVTASYELNTRGEVAPPPVVVGKLTPTPTLAPPRPKARPVVAIGLEPALAVEFDRIGPGVSAMLLVRYLWTKSWGVEALGLLPVVRGETREEVRGKASAAVSAAGLGLTFSWQERNVAALFGLGMMAAQLEVVGANAGPGLEDSQDSLALGAPYLRAGAGLRVFDAVRIRVDASLSCALRPVPIMFVQDEVASWGRPSLLVGIGPELLLP
ncbi:MAG: hypothetical protein JW940_01685 [Polyangiaceae bacterium]|nr:hypothetical protein [Polyangiaceae bacterium]